VLVGADAFNVPFTTDHIIVLPYFGTNLISVTLLSAQAPILYNTLSHTHILLYNYNIFFLKYWVKNSSDC
jgi:hypothetical protein